MPHAIAPIACKPWMLNELSERLIVRHYENNYGAAVRSLNAIRKEVETLDFAATPNHRLRATKREELAAMGSVYLHELYFATLGGDGAALFTGSGPGTRMDAPATTLINTILIGVVGALALASGLAFGLGGRDKAAEWLERASEAGGEAAPKAAQAARAAKKHTERSRDRSWDVGITPAPMRADEGSEPDRDR